MYLILVFGAPSERRWGFATANMIWCRLHDEDTLEALREKGPPPRSGRRVLAGLSTPPFEHLPRPPHDPTQSNTCSCSNVSCVNCDASVTNWSTVNQHHIQQPSLRDTLLTLTRRDVTSRGDSPATTKSNHESSNKLHRHHIEYAVLPEVMP